jgi:predicted MFS family arabinose efflux permease
MSVTFAIGAIGWGIAVALTNVDVSAFGYATLTGINAVLVALVFRGRWPRPQRLPRGARGGVGSLATAPGVILFLVALFLMFAPYAGTYSFVAVRIASLGGGAAFVGLAAGLQAAAEVPSMVASSRYAARLRPTTIFAGGAAFYLAVYAIWSVVTIPAVLASTRVLAGLAFGLTSVGAVVIADELVPERLRATGQASSKAVTAGLAPVAGSLGGGLVYGAFGAAAMFVVAAILTAASTAVAWVAESAFLGRRPVVEQT